MILGDTDPPHALPGARATLDDLFRRAGVRRPDALALVDPANRATMLPGAPRRMTYAQADRAASAIAGRLQRLGLPPDTIVGIHLPHTVESIITLLGVLRAGMIAAPLPLLWRRAEAAAALSRLGAKVLIAGGEAGGANLVDIAMTVAADVFAVRYLCGYGADLPDGVIALDPLLDSEDTRTMPAIRNGGITPGHVAVITWDVSAEGLTPVARSHVELISGGLGVSLEAGLPDQGAILSTCPASSFAGLALGVVPWLLTGGTLALHQPFDPDVFRAQAATHGCETVVVPGPLVERLRDNGSFAHPELQHVLALWRAPERMASSALWTEQPVRLTDILAFGETGLFALRRGLDGRPAAIPEGPIQVTREGDDAITIIETQRTAHGTLALRGPGVSGTPFPAPSRSHHDQAERGEAGSAVDTGFACRPGPMAGTLVVSGPPAGIVSVGGYRFLLRDLQAAARQAEPDAAIAALPDALGGHRLAGQSAQADHVRDMLRAAGINPLVSDAFRPADDEREAARADGGQTVTCR